MKQENLKADIRDISYKAYSVEIFLHAYRRYDIQKKNYKCDYAQELKITICEKNSANGDTTCNCQ